jgi:hypothetical protein
MAEPVLQRKQSEEEAVAVRQHKVVLQDNRRPMSTGKVADGRTAQPVQRRVQPTVQMKAGVPVNDDKGLEHEADVMGGAALSMGHKAIQMADRVKKVPSFVNAIQRVTEGDVSAEGPSADKLSAEEWKTLQSLAPALLFKYAKSAGVLPGDKNNKTVKDWVFSPACTVVLARKILAAREESGKAVSNPKVEASKAATAWMGTGEVPRDIGTHIDALRSLRDDADAQELAEGMHLEASRSRSVSSVEVSKISELGSGKMGATHRVSTPSSHLDQVFKRDVLPAEPSLAATRAGINPVFPRASARSEAVSRLDEALGLGSIPATHTVRLPGRPHTGSLMGMARGASMESMSSGQRALAFQSPEVRRGLMDLQLIDFITGEVDRHHGNIFISPEGHVQGIDNDLSFGHKAQPGHGYNKGVPQYIDMRTAKKILAMPKEQLVKLFDGLLTRSEITGAMQRLEHLQEVIQAAIEQGRVNHGGWGAVDDSTLNDRK